MAVLRAPSSLCHTRSWIGGRPARPAAPLGLDRDRMNDPRRPRQQSTSDPVALSAVAEPPRGGVVAADVLRNDDRHERRPGTQAAGHVDKLDLEHGAVDILVNNAGIYPSAAIEETTSAEWAEVFAVNVDATFVCLQAAARSMGQGRRARS
jgi:NAD(P)-dependent dehydrogenase (short-subunit alcohol dehydrogenase family)